MFYSVCVLLKSCCYGNRKVLHLAYRNKFVLINIACLIALTINFEGLTP